MRSVAGFFITRTIFRSLEGKKKIKYRLVRESALIGPSETPQRGPRFHGASTNKNEEGVISARLTPVKPCKTGNPSDLFHQVKQKKVSPGMLGRSQRQINFTATRGWRFVEIGRQRRELGPRICANLRPNETLLRRMPRGMFHRASE